MVVVAVVVLVTCSALSHSHHILEGDVSLRAAVNTVGDRHHGNRVEGAAAGAVSAAAKRPWKTEEVDVKDRRCKNQGTRRKLE